MSAREAAIASIRFGLGPRPGELAHASTDPRGWLAEQIRTAAPASAALNGLAPGRARMAEFQQALRNGPEALQKALRAEFREIYRAEAAARTLAQVQSETPFRERLVAFWSNHFTVSIQRPPLLPLAGAFEREAIRPHVAGRFVDMLLAVARHPAMLVYLDNAISVGPNSFAGQRRNRGLNENLAREILELHTLGVNGGYSQDDVRAFAKILTGWSVTRIEDGSPGNFQFNPRLHEPGPKTLLGVRFGDGGESEGVRAFTMLAHHPATARHIATKLARHFIADNPPQAAVERLARVYRDTEGDLGIVSLALIEAKEAWKTPLGKVKSANDYIVSVARAVAFEGDAQKLLGSLRALGQLPFAAPSPAGWPDTAEDWVGPESVLRRAEWAYAAAQRAARPPHDVLAATIGPLAAEPTMDAVEHAPSATDGLALVFASPEFQRR